jgi:hypothetical protein
MMSLYPLFLLKNERGFQESCPPKPTVAQELPFSGRITPIIPGAMRSLSDWPVLKICERSETRRAGQEHSPLITSDFKTHVFECRENDSRNGGPRISSDGHSRCAAVRGVSGERRQNPFVVRDHVLIRLERWLLCSSEL